MVFRSLLVGAGLSSAIAVSTLPQRPANPRSILVYGLRPYNLTADLSDKDTADAAGDVFFFLGDRLLIPTACRNDPHWVRP
jgi:hypothetical protein